MANQKGDNRKNGIWEKKGIILKKNKIREKLLKICANKLSSALLEACLALESNQNIRKRLKLCSGVVQSMCIFRVAEK